MGAFSAIGAIYKLQRTIGKHSPYFQHEVNHEGCDCMIWQRITPYMRSVNGRNWGIRCSSHLDNGINMVLRLMLRTKTPGCRSGWSPRGVQTTWTERIFEIGSQLLVIPFAVVKVSICNYRCEILRCLFQCWIGNCGTRTVGRTNGHVHGREQGLKYHGLKLSEDIFMIVSGGKIIVYHPNIHFPPVHIGGFCAPRTWEPILFKYSKLILTAVFTSCSINNEVSLGSPRGR